MRWIGLVVAASALLGGCTQRAKDGQNIIAQAEDSGREIFVCTGESLKSDLTKKSSGKTTKETTYFVVDKISNDLLEWNSETGDPVSICHDWGEACVVEIHPLKITAKAAKSSEQTLDLQISRQSGYLVEEYKDFDDLTVSTARCRKGSLPTPDVAKNAV